MSNMGDKSEKLKNVKENCVNNPNKPELMTDFNDLMQEFGFTTDQSQTNYTVRKRVLNSGEAWESQAFCMGLNPEKRIPSSEFSEQLNVFKEVQNKLPNTFKTDKGGLGFDKEQKEWCSSDPNVIIDVSNKLKQKMNYTTKVDVKPCQFINKVRVESEVTKKPEEKPVLIQSPIEKKITESEPKPVSLLEKSEIQGIIEDKSAELFIPIEGNLDRTIESAIREDGNKPTKEQLVSYKTEGYDPNTNEKYVKTNVMLTNCYKNGKRGFCSPIGLAENVKKLLESKKITMDIDDKRILPEPHKFKLKGGIKLRDYQQPIADEAVKKGHGIIELATGGGKTIIATDIIGEIGQNTVFIVPNNSLFFNARTQIEQYTDPKDVSVGQVGGMGIDYKHDPNKTNVNIVSLPLSALAFSSPDKIDPKKREIVIKALNEANTVVVDETHHISADTYKVVMTHTPAKYRFGLSATPYRDDGKTLEIVGGVGNPIGRIRAKQLIDRGFLTPVEIITIDNTDIDPRNDSQLLKNLQDESCKINPKTKMYKNVKELNRIPDRHSAEKKMLHMYIEKGNVECNKARNDRIIDITKKLNAYGKTNVVFVSSVEHGRKLQEQLEEQNIFSELLTSDEESEIALDDKEVQDQMTRLKKRNALFERMKKGELKTIIATDKIMGEGVDIPAIDTILLGDMKKSTINAIQMVGRGLRLKEGKKKTLVFDFHDPAEYLEDWMDTRHKIWKGEQYPISNHKFSDVNTILEDNYGKIDIEAKLQTQSETNKKNIVSKNQRKDYNNMTIPELKEEAKSKGIKGITKLKKRELINELMK